MRNIWGFDTSGEVDDMAMFFSCAEYEMVAKRLVDAGAVEPNSREAHEMIRVAESVTPKEESEITDECLKTHTIVECDHCNYVHFIPQWCEVTDWIDGTCDGCNQPGQMHITHVGEEEA